MRIAYKLIILKGRNKFLNSEVKYFTINSKNFTIYIFIMYTKMKSIYFGSLGDRTFETTHRS